MDSFTKDNNFKLGSYSRETNEYEINSNFSPFSKSQEMWKSPSCDLDTSLGQLGMKNTWDPLTSTSHRSSNLSDVGASLPNSARHFGAITEDIYGTNEKENVFPMYTKAVGNKGCYNAPSDKRDCNLLSKDLLFPYQDLSSNVWTTNPKTPYGSCSQNTVTGSDSYGFGNNPMSWEPVHSSFRPALRDIGNITNSLPSANIKNENIHFVQSPSEFSSHPFNIPTNDSYSNQQTNTSSFHQQKQHTGNCTLTNHSYSTIKITFDILYNIIIR